MLCRSFIQTYGSVYGFQVDKMDRGYHGVGGPLTVSQFPYHPPLSFAIVKAGEELGKKPAYFFMILPFCKKIQKHGRLYS